MPYFDRFDICEAYYVFAMLWHGGGGTKEYAMLGRLSNMGFKPRPSLNDRSSLEENGQEIYDGILARYGYVEEED